MATGTLSLLPENYVELSEQELDERILQAKAALGSRVVILGHHYQRDEVVKFADYRGDSLKLSRLAASRKEAEYIVFCGVHFMAESADILREEHQVVILPDLNAGCSMADMADLEQLEVCWEEVSGRLKAKVVPVTYINSTAAIKGLSAARAGRSARHPTPERSWNGPSSAEKKDCLSPMSTWEGTRLIAWGFLWTKWPCGIRMKKRAD